MKIDCELKVNKKGDGYYLYIPVLEKFVFLEKVEQKLLKLLIEKKEVANKSDNK